MKVYLALDINGDYEEIVIAGVFSDPSKIDNPAQGPFNTKRFEIIEFDLDMQTEWKSNTY